MPIVTQPQILALQHLKGSRTYAYVKKEYPEEQQDQSRCLAISCALVGGLRVDRIRTWLKGPSEGPSAPKPLRYLAPRGRRQPQPVVTMPTYDEVDEAVPDLAAMETPLTIPYEVLPNQVTVRRTDRGWFIQKVQPE